MIFILPCIHESGWSRAESYPEQGPLIAENGMVASTNPLTSQVGLDTLRNGGNAVDAAIAMAATHTVSEPHTGHLGGDTFLLLHLADRDEAIAMNGGGAAPDDATFDYYEQIGDIPNKGPLAANIPGTVSCWAEANRRFGRCSFDALLQPAIQIAKEGFPVQNRLARALERTAPTFREFKGSATQFLDAKGNPPRPGTVLAQPWLADSLTTIAQDHGKSFYQGDLAKQIVDYWRSIGGLFSYADFDQHRTDSKTPLWTTYRGFDITQQPLPSQGILHLLLLNILEQFPINEWGTESAEAIHHIQEAKKRVFQLREEFLGDPRWVNVPIDYLLDQQFAAKIAADIDSEYAAEIPHPSKESSDTDYMCIVDEDRNVVSYSHSLFSGCGVTVPQVGALFNSRMLNFNLQRGHPNALAPGKRPLHTLNSWIISHSGQPLVVGGITAGDLQVQFNTQIISHFIDGGYQLHEAFNAPRWGNRLGLEVTIEDRGQENVLADLERRGHRLTRQPAWGATGRGHAIAIDYERGVLIGHSENRDEGGVVLGY